MLILAVMKSENGDRCLVYLVITPVVSAFWLNQDEVGISGHIGGQHDLRGQPVETLQGDMRPRRIRGQRAL